MPIEEEFEIPFLMKILTIPRQDGKQRVILLYIYDDPEEYMALPHKTLEAIKQVQIDYF
jgi:hypothetical protein